MLDHNQREIHPFFTRGRHENIDVYYLSQRYFELPLIIRDNSNIIILFKQTAKTVQNLYNDIAGFDMITMNLKIYVERHGIKNIVILKLID